MRGRRLALRSLFGLIGFLVTAPIASGQFCIVTDGGQECSPPGYDVWATGGFQFGGGDTDKVRVFCVPNFQEGPSLPPKESYPPSLIGEDSGTWTAHIHMPPVGDAYYENHTPTGWWVFVQVGYWEGAYWYPCYSSTYYGAIPRQGSCFAAGTPLLTPRGSKPVEQFRVGDLILCSPESGAQGPIVVSRVKETIRSRARLVEIAVGGQLLRPSEGHPFYVRGKAWTAAASLSVGDLLRADDGRWLPVDSVADCGGDGEVYSVRVEDYHTYFVGGPEWGFSVWVHESCENPTPRLHGPADSRSGSFWHRARLFFDRAYREVARCWTASR